MHQHQHNDIRDDPAETRQFHHRQTDTQVIKHEHAWQGETHCDRLDNEDTDSTRQRRQETQKAIWTVPDKQVRFPAVHQSG